MGTLKSLLLLAVAAGCFRLSGIQNRSLERMRRDRQITPGRDVVINASPLITFTTVVLGGFRGLLADILWLRMTFLQDEGRYFELVQLADWVTKLEPRSTEIWGYHAWNMAYNVSVLMPRPEDRWRWVRNGMELLRDEGLVYHPSDPQLYAELGWMFQHKIGGETDREHLYYKKQWAREMQSLFGGARPAYGRIHPRTADRMRTGFRLVPEVMQEIEGRYGRLDWRLPETHALYWAYRGSTLDMGDLSDFGFVSCDRMIAQSLAALLLSGRLEFDENADRYRRGPDTTLLPGALAAHRAAMQRHGNPAFREAYANFIRAGIVDLYDASEKDAAQHLLEILQREFPSADTQRDLPSFVGMVKELRKAGRP